MTEFIVCPECGGEPIDKRTCTYCAGSGHIPRRTHEKREIAKENIIVDNEGSASD